MPKITKPLDTDMKIWQGIQNWRVVLEIDAPPPNAIGLDVKWPCAIGRSDRHVRVQLDIDLMPFDGDEHGVSRRHAVLLPHDSGLMIMDIGSTNGTWLNGDCMESGFQYPLEEGDIVEFGTLKTIVRSVTRLDETNAAGYSTIVTRRGSLE